jgi:outer membrane protein
MGLCRNKNSEKRALGRAFLFAMIVCLTPAHSSAAGVEPNAEQTTAYEQSTEGARLKLLLALAKQGQHELADTLLHRYPLTGKYANNRTLYVEGLVLKGRKDNKAAVEKFRAALADNPKLTLVRSDLAQTLAEMGEDDSAKHHLQLLESEAPDEQAAANIRSFIDRIDQNRPYRFNAYISLAPSTNVNNGSSHTTTKVYSPVSDFPLDWDIPASHRKKSGIGTAQGVNASYSKRMGEHWLAVAGAGAHSKIYSDKDFNSYGLSQSFDVRYLQNNASIGVGVVGSESFDNRLKGITNYSFGPRVSTSVNLSARDVISENILFEWRRYPDAKAVNGWASFTDLSWNHAFDASLNTTVSFGFDRIKSDFKPYSYKTWYAGLSVYKELPYGVSVNLDGQAQRSIFDEYNVMGGTFRKDTRLIGSLGLIKRDWNIYGFAPSVEFTYVQNLSNLNSFDYNSQAVDIRLTKDF